MSWSSLSSSAQQQPPPPPVGGSCSLGRPTRRGVRKCPSCGTVNGTRGICCKNRNCDVIFKGAAERKKAHLEARRLIITDSPAPPLPPPPPAVSVSAGNPSGCVGVTFYSVRSRERGPERRGFVMFRRSGGGGGGAEELPAEARNAGGGCVGRKSGVHWSRGWCKVASCPRSSALMPPASEAMCCVHVAACLSTGGADEPREAQPLTVKHSVLNAMHMISPDWKHLIWLRARRDGPIAQRVSSSTMVVKCEPDDRHPLGYLHISFAKASSAAASASCPSSGGIACSCKSPEKAAPLGPLSPITAASSPSVPTLGASDDGTSQQLHRSWRRGDLPDSDRCIHFYSCMAAFLSDVELSREFSDFIQADLAASGGSVPQLPWSVGDGNSSSSRLNSIVNNVRGGARQLSVRTRDKTQEASTRSAYPGDLGGGPNLRQGSRKRSRPLLPKPAGVDVVELPAFLAKGTANDARAPGHDAEQQLTAADGPGDLGIWSSLEWLSSVTESLNLVGQEECQHCLTLAATMPNPPGTLRCLRRQTLSFPHVPHTLFEVLRSRLTLYDRWHDSKANQGRRSLEAARQNRVPQEQPSTFRWKLTCLRSARDVFDTDLIQLAVVQSGGPTEGDPYILSSTHPEPIFQLEGPDVAVHMMAAETRGGGGSFANGPHGGSFSHILASSSSPIVIEWTPNALPISKVGELRLEFIVGHEPCIIYSSCNGGQ